MYHNFWSFFYLAKVDLLLNNKATYFQSMIWVNKTQKSRQVSIDYSDITAIIAKVKEKVLFFILVYILYSSTNKQKNQKYLQN